MVQLDRLSLARLADAAAARYAGKKAFSVVSEGNEGEELSFREFGRRARGFAGALSELGVGPGDRVMLLAENRPEWPIAYFGIALAGAVSVPVLTDFRPEHVGTVAGHAEIRAVCATEKTLPKLRESGSAVFGRIPVLRLDRMDAAGLAAEIDGAARTVPLSDFAPADPAEDDPASIIYTSGTTGSSKGVVLSHRNIVFDAAACRSIIRIYPRDRFLSVLPLAHSYECTIGLVIAVLNGASTAYLDRAPAPPVLLPALRAVRPTMMLTVPLIIEKIYRNRILPALEEHPLYRFRPTRSLAVKAAGRKLLGTFGGAVRFFGIGGAALAPDTEAFLKAAGFPYAIGYGLTETAPLLAGAPPFRTALRSTGPALAGVDLRVVDAEGRDVSASGAEGEIQARGPNVMRGYYKDPARTAEAFTEDGWFRTGDLGCFDAKRRLYIKGRLKAMILGPSGENIYPEEIEGVLNASDMVEESLVYEGEKGEIVALVYLNEKARTMLAAAEDSAAQALEQAAKAVGGAAAKASELLAELKTSANKRLSAFSRIHRVELHHEPFEKTATQKIKRFLYPKKKS